MSIIKGIAAVFSIFICYILCSAAVACYLKAFEKSLEFGREFIGMEYSAVVHQFGREPDVIEKLTMNKTDKEFKNSFGSFIDSCNYNHQVIKFTYKRVIGDVTLWAYDNNEFIEIILAR